MDHYICIHGHFYQPPRENPWLEAVELQDSAAPYHDWNARITAECYAPNTSARILDGGGTISAIVNNYSRISFNMGPTLLAWLETHSPETYRALLDADRDSLERFSGHGSAIAQAYNHLIMPLANRRDKETQVVWGLRDFERRFGRPSEGLWLPEAAVDLETLEIMAAHGVAYAILSPYQAARIRPLSPASDEELPWTTVSGGRFDPSMPYAVCLPSGRTIAVFFYDGPISRAVAFEGLLQRGENLANRLASAFSSARSHPQLVSIATDGESYGHHHRHGDMGLAYALAHIEQHHLARLTTYGEFLALYPPTFEVELFENSSWSCFHGVERWRSNCGCNSGRPEWTQHWREPLRATLDWLRDTVAPRFEQVGSELLRDPWAARNDYIDVILDRSPESIDAFVQQHASGALDEVDQVALLKLLELQRNAMLMYTSCGWFFDDISGIESVQIIQYAGRVLQLAEEVLDLDLLPDFLDRIELAQSNVPANRNGRRVYEQFVKPAVVDLPKVAAHYAMTSLFEEYGEQATIYCYRIERKAYQSWSAGAARLAIGRVRVVSTVTGETALLSFGVLHFGDHNLVGGVRQVGDEKRYRIATGAIAEAFERADLAEVLRLLTEQFGQLTYSLRSLFRDEQRKILGPLLAAPVAEAEAAYRQIYERSTALMRFLTDLHIPVPRSFGAAAEFALGGELRQQLAGDDLDVVRVRAILDDARRAGIGLNNNSALGYVLEQTIKRLTGQFRAQPQAILGLRRLVSAVELARTLPLPVNLWAVQNTYYELLRSSAPAVRATAETGDSEATQWVAAFAVLGTWLGVGEMTPAPVAPA